MHCGARAILIARAPHRVRSPATGFTRIPERTRTQSTSMANVKPPESDWFSVIFRSWSCML